MSQAVLYDQLGPRGRRRALVASTAVTAVIVALLVIAVRRFGANGQLDADKWRVFTEAQTVKFLWQGLKTTLKAAAISMVLSVAIGALLALGRLSRMRLVRWVAGAYVEVFRSVPLLLLIFFSARGLQGRGVQLDLFWYLVSGLVLYNSAILGEIFRAGILSLDRGQTEAAYAVGLGYWPAMLYVVIPQAVRRMLPSLVSQLVTLLKDTTLGFALPVEELLQNGRIVGQAGQGQELQAFIVVAVVFILINLTLSRVARRLEVRQRRRYGAGGVGGVTEDLAVLDVAAEAELTKRG